MCVCVWGGGGGGGRVKVEESVEKLSQNALFPNFVPKFYNRGKVLVQKYVIKGLPEIPGKM